MHKGIIFLSLLIIIGIICFLCCKRPLKIGSEIKGFIVEDKEIVVNNGRLDTIFTLKHLKTDAKILYIKNDDSHRFFGIAFNTPVTDSTGVQHIIEHSVLSSSRKYKDNDLFFNLAKQTPATFLNAATATGQIFYYYQTINNKDFANLMDIYLDTSLFAELSKTTFDKEAWSLNLDDKGNLTYNGVVYNEMKNYYSSPSYYWYKESLKTLFSGSEFESGGNPEFIPDLTYENFLKYYKLTHTPTNSFVLIYGNGDIKKDLNKLDNEFSQFDKKKQIKAPVNEVIIKEIVKEIPYPADKMETKSIVAFSYAVGNSNDEKEIKKVEVLKFILAEYEDAVLKKEIINKGLATNVSIDFDLVKNNLVLFFVFYGVQEPEKLQKSFNKIMQNISKNGTDKKIENAAINSEKFNINNEDRFFLTNEIINIFVSYLYGGDFKKILKKQELYNAFEKDITPSFTADLVKKWIVDNNSKVVIIAKPDSKLFEKNQKKLDAKLQKIKSEMTEDELKNTRKLTIEREQMESKKNAKFPVLKMSNWKDLPLLDNPEIIDIDGVKIFNHKKDLPLEQIVLAFDFKHIPLDKLPIISVYKLIFDKMDLIDMSNEEFVLKQYEELGNVINNEIYISPNEKDIALKYFVIIPSFKDKQNVSLKLLDNLIKKQKYDEGRIKNIILREVDNIEQSYRQNGEPVFTQYSDFAIIKSKLNGKEYFNYLKNLLKNWDKEYPKFIKDLNETNKQLFVKDNLLIDYVGLNLNQKEMKNFIEKLPSQTQKKLSHKFNIVKKNEARIIPALNYKNYLICNLDIKNRPYFSFLTDFITYNYLYPEVRIKGGAYGSKLQILNSGEMTFHSYADPNMIKTFGVYNNTPEFLKNFEIKDKDFDALKLKTLVKYVMPRTDFENGEYYLHNYINNRDLKTIQKEYNLIKNMDKDDIKKLHKEFEECLKNKNIATYGNKDLIEKNKKMFDEIK